MSLLQMSICAIFPSLILVSVLIITLHISDGSPHKSKLNNGNDNTQLPLMQNPP